MTETSNDHTKLVEHATCTFCGCVCDDMDLTVDTKAKRIVKAKNACILGKAWFAEHTISDRPVAMIDGQEVAFDDAIEEAALSLAKARFRSSTG